jgi:hypothetical protein
VRLLLLLLLQAAAFLQARPHRAEASLLGGSMQLSTFGSHGGSSSSRTSLELDDGSLDPSAAAAIRGLNKSSSNREQRRQAEGQLAANAVGPSRGINPLANAIDMSPSAQTAASKVRSAALHWKVLQSIWWSASARR